MTMPNQTFEKICATQRRCAGTIRKRNFWAAFFSSGQETSTHSSPLPRRYRGLRLCFYSWCVPHPSSSMSGLHSTSCLRSMISTMSPQYASFNVISCPLSTPPRPAGHAAPVGSLEQICAVYPLWCTAEELSNAYFAMMCRHWWAPPRTCFESQKRLFVTQEANTRRNEVRASDALVRSAQLRSESLSRKCKKRD